MGRAPSPWGGIAGPTVFTAAWVIGGALEPGYSPSHDAISRLAAVGAPARPLMTTGLAGFGLGLAVHARALRAAVPGPAWKAALGAGVTVLGVVAFPLQASARIDAVHGAIAVAAYGALVAMPLLATKPLAAAGHGVLATLSAATGVVAGLCLAGSVLGVAPGLLQRVGLTLVNSWIVGGAAGIVRMAPGTGDGVTHRV